MTSFLVHSKHVDSIADTYYEICEVLQDIIFPEHCWITASNFLQQFWMYCLLNQQFINSNTTTCLGFPETVIQLFLEASNPECLFRKYLKQIKKKQGFVAGVNLTNKKVFSRSSRP